MEKQGFTYSRLGSNLAYGAFFIAVTGKDPIASVNYCKLLFLG